MAEKKEKKLNILNLLQLIFEIIVACGFVLGLIPFVYLAMFFLILPLVVVNLVFSIIQKNGTMPFTIVNIVMVFLSLIPILGYLFRITGLVMSILSAVKLSKELE